MIVEASTGTAEIATRQRLDVRTKVLYGTGDVSTAIKTVAFGVFALYFYSTVMGLPATLVGICSAVGSIWNALIDPYIGYVSDNLRGRLGRRHTFMLAGSLTMGISFWALFSPPTHLPQLGLFLWLLVTLLLVRTTTSLFAVPYYALGAELSQDYNERTSINALRGALALIGTLGTVGISFVVFFPDRLPGVDPKLNYAGYPAMGLVFGLTMTIVGLIATTSTLAWRSQATPRAETKAAVGSFLGGFSQCLRNRSFRALFFSFAFFYLGIIMNTSLSIHYFTYYVKITSSAALSMFQVILYSTSFVGVLFWLFLSRYVQKHRLYFAATLAMAVLTLSARLLVGEGRLFGTGNILVVAIGEGLAGFFSSVIWFMPTSMLADVADEDELETGERREGAFFGIQLFGQQLAAGASVLLTGILIDWFAGLHAGQSYQSPATVQRIGILYSLLPAAILLVAALCVLRYSLTHSRLTIIQAELARRRAAPSR